MKITMTIKSPIFLTGVLLSLVCCAMVPAYALDPLDPFSPTRVKVLERYHRAGLNGDRSHAPEMIHILQTNVYTDVRKTILLTMARLGDTDALPVIDAILQNKDTDSRNSAFARAARAHLLAETEPTPHAQAERFFRELGETPAQLNATLHAFMAGKAGPIVPLYPFQEEDAGEQLADLIYYGHTQELLADLLIAQVHFSLWYFAPLKIEMAQLSPDQQRHILVDRLARAKVWDSDEQHEAQILVDLGHKQAAELAAAKLQEMDGERNSYTTDGFRSLFGVLYAAEDDSHQSPLWAYFLHHPDPTFDPKIRAAASNVSSGRDIGRGDVFVPGY